jgi:hypothetical protein
MPAILTAIAGNVMGHDHPIADPEAGHPLPDP